MDSASSSPEQIQIEFKPLILASESTSVPNGSFALSMLPGEILRKMGEFSSVEAMRNFIATCKYFRNQLDARFLQVLASENNPDRATSEFIVDAIGKESNICLWRNVKFLVKDYAIPKELSIHLFVNTTAEKILSDEVRSMIIQVSGLPESYEENCEFLKFLLLKVSFKKLKCLMFCGIELSMKFSQEIGTLNLDVFHINSRYRFNPFRDEFFCYWDSLKTLYVTHLGVIERVFPPKKLKKLVIYCPKSRKDVIDRSAYLSGGLLIYVEDCHALKEM